MGKFRRWRWVGLLSALGLLLVFWPLGCVQEMVRPSQIATVPVVRVRMLQDQSQVALTASYPPIVYASSDNSPKRLNVPREGAVLISYGAGGWQLGNAAVGIGELVIQPAADGSVAINGQAHRGRYRLVPTGSGRFDVVNDVDIDGYLKGVLAKELLPNWNLETYKAQAIVARTYALYEARTTGSGRYWDLYADQRSQVYGGIAAESNRSRVAVDATSGVVVAYGPAGNEKIFKAYFSSCCGGITQSATDAFGDPYIVPLSDRDQRGLCSGSPRFNWGPVVIRKNELTRRIRLWGWKRNRPEKDMAMLFRIDVQARNRWGRPVRYVVMDKRGARYSLGGEELRWAVNTDATDGIVLPSSFFNTINDPDQVRFVEGHGFGHGVGMCQWCAQRQAEAGMRHEDIVLAAFQRSRLVRAY